MNAWEQQEGESDKAYLAFCSYRDMGSGRSLRAAWGLQKGDRKATTIPGHWVGWSEQHDWVSRARAYDAHLELTTRQTREAEHAKELAAFRERARKAAADTAAIATAALLKAGQRLQTLTAEQIEPGMVPAFLRAAANVMEASLNAEAEAIGVRRLETLLDNASDKDKGEG